MQKNARLDPDEIAANLKTERIGKKIVVYSSTSSTNNVAMQYAKNKKNNGLAIFAEEQTLGKGRLGNKWYSKPQESILCSVLLTSCKLNTELLSTTSAVAVAEAIGDKVKIKWPNDIIFNEKKVAGILLETTSENSEKKYVIGIGINCNQKKDSFPAQLREIATSIRIENKKKCDRILLAKRLLISLDGWLKTAESDSKKVIKRWLQLSNQLGQRVTLLFNGKKFSGNCIGIDPEKGLTLQLDSGAIRMFDAAHTSIVKQLL